MQVRQDLGHPLLRPDAAHYNSFWFAPQGTSRAAPALVWIDNSLGLAIDICHINGLPGALIGADPAPVAKFFIHFWLPARFGPATMFL